MKSVAVLLLLFFVVTTIARSQSILFDEADQSKGGEIPGNKLSLVSDIDKEKSMASFKVKTNFKNTGKLSRWSALAEVKGNQTDRILTIYGKDKDFAKLIKGGLYATYAFQNKERIGITDQLIWTTFGYQYQYNAYSHLNADSMIANATKKTQIHTGLLQFSISGLFDVVDNGEEKSQLSHFVGYSFQSGAKPEMDVLDDENKVVLQTSFYSVAHGDTILNTYSEKKAFPSKIGVSPYLRHRFDYVLIFRFRKPKNAEKDKSHLIATPAEYLDYKMLKEDPAPSATASLTSEQKIDSMFSILTKKPGTTNDYNIGINAFYQIESFKQKEIQSVGISLLLFEDISDYARKGAEKLFEHKPAFYSGIGFEYPIIIKELKKEVKNDYAVMPALKVGVNF